MSGATITARGITILLFDWKRFFFPMDDQSKTGKIFFTVSCIELSNESHGLVGGMTLKYELKGMSIQLYFPQDLVKSL